MFLDRLLLFFPIRVIFPVFVLLTLIGVGAYFGWVEIRDTQERLKREKLEYLCRTAANFQEISEFSVWKNDIEIVERKLINLSADPFIDIVFVAAPEKKIILSSKRKFIGKDYVTALKTYAPNSYSRIKKIISDLQKKVGLVCKVLEEEDIIIATAPILFFQEGLRTTSTGFLYVQYNLKELKGIYRHEIITKLFKQYGILLVMFGLLYLGFNKLIGERINIIVKAIQEISKGNMSVRINLKGKDEFSFIADVINNLIERLNRYISYDYLTGILNRFGLEKEIQNQIKKNPNLWNIFILIDLDNFKDVNDTFGHDVGDKLLRKFARRLKEVATGKITGRLGGDEFVIFFQSKEKPPVEHLLHKWMEELTKDIIWEENQFEINLTSGVSVKKGNPSFFEMLKESDIALYSGKKKGKKMFVIFDETLQLQEERRVKLSEIIKKSKEKDSFYLVYQPIFDIKTNKIYKLEALLRMKEINGMGEVSPVEFIPVLEETGRIKEVGYWVIEEVSEQIKRWYEKGSVWIPVSINIDIQQLLDEGFVKKVKGILQKHNINSRCIKFEITESEAMKFPEKVIKVLKELTQTGIEISIDDFGTGYSSLSYMKIMPVSYVKIDRSFVKNIPYSREDNMLVMTVVNLAKSFGFKTIAEGVEEKVQLLFLQEIGCNYVQGYYFSRPVSPEKIEQMLKEYQT